MSQGSSSSASIPEPERRPSLIFNGVPTSMEDMPTFNAALYFAGELLKEKLQSDVHLCKLNFGCSVTWHDGKNWMIKSFLPSVTAMGFESPPSRKLGERFVWKRD